MTDRLGGVETLGTNVDAVLDAMAPENAEGIVQLRQPIISRRITTVSQEPISLQQASRADKSVWIPPERWATRRAAGAENTFIQPIKL